jgi:clan AA aspartic protease
MITGRVNSKIEAMIALTVRGPRGEEREVEAVVDTGFSAYLTLPPAITEELGLDSVAAGQLTLADGSEVATDLCYASVAWDGRERRIVVDTLQSEVLVGMALMEGHDLNVHIVAGGLVTIASFSLTTPAV